MAVALLGVAMLPLAGCDSAGSNGVGDDGGETSELDAPDDLDAEVKSGTIELSWTPVEDADSYHVYRSKSSIEDTDSSPFAADVSDTSYVDDTPERDTSYHYRVTSIGAEGAESEFSDEVEIELPLSAPDNFDASVQSGAVDLTWEAGDGASTYTLYRSTDSIESTDSSPLADGLSSTSYSDQSVEQGKVYYYRATSVASEGAESEFTPHQRVETPPADPASGGGDGSWTRVKTSTDNDINDVAVTAEGAYAVADGGILLKRQSDKWATVLQDGPSSNGNDLLGMGVTDDGDHIWFVGSSGAAGEYDVTTGTLVKDRSGLNENTSNNLQGVVVSGTAGSANVQVIDASGKVYNSTDNGTTWSTATPGSGAAIRAIDGYASKSAYLADANQSIYETTDNGSTWQKGGIADANVSLYGVDGDATDDVWVSAGNGTIYQWNGSTWTKNGVGEPNFMDVEVAGDDQSGFVVGGSGTLFSYDGTDWSAQDTPTSNNLNAVLLSTSSTPAIAVGAGGTVIER